MGISRARIFIINPQGTMTTGKMRAHCYTRSMCAHSCPPDNLTYKKTYTDLSALVAEMFPPKKGAARSALCQFSALTCAVADHTVPDDYSDANYWRDTSLEWPLE